METMSQPESITPSKAREDLRNKMRAQGSRTNGFNETPAVIGAKNSFLRTMKEKIVRSHFNRKKLLSVPQEIKDSHPDKHFVWVNYSRMEKQSFFHSEGYEIFRNPQDPENVNNEKFLANSQGLVRRNEMVLAYIPKDEYEYRQAERAIVRENKDVTEVLTKNKELIECSPLGKEEKEYLLAIKNPDKE